MSLARVSRAGASRMCGRRHGLQSLCVVVALLISPFCLGRTVDPVYQIKASYIYNILQFVEFPRLATQAQAVVNVCVLGEDRFGAALDEIDSASSPSGGIKVHRLQDNIAAVAQADCHVLYLVDSGLSPERVLASVDPLQVLTIGESPSFRDAGGLVELFRVGNRVRFRLNQELVNRTSFKMGAQLVQLGM